MKLFPASADLDPLMRAVVSAFEPHRPESQSEEARGDAFTTLCCDLCRDGAEQMDSVFAQWLQKHWTDESVRWFFSAAWSNDVAEMNRARDFIIGEFQTDHADCYEDDARVRMQELADEAANEDQA